MQCVRSGFVSIVLGIRGGVENYSNFLRNLCNDFFAKLRADFLLKNFYPVSFLIIITLRAMQPTQAKVTLTRPSMCVHEPELA